MRHIKYIIIHTTGTPQNTTVQSILNYWRKTLGWKFGGYHFLIEADGTIHRLHPLSQVTNGVKGFNSPSVHICYIGGEGGEDTRTEEQKEAILECFAEIYTELSEHQEVDSILLRGHRDFSPDTDESGEVESHEWIKTCPNFDVLDEYWWVQGSQAISKGRVIFK